MSYAPMLADVAGLERLIFALVPWSPWALKTSVVNPMEIPGQELETTTPQLCDGKLEQKRFQT
jgi:hypothetical protein|eukprot:CAMPEP_0169123916 /NCGR_PEP_ID=MMETSP1015-20121227/34042_1 /TAXON_ID=342587 /ORGANISM="Karlodinium micrum, Strain CCMP2283" /LENGTH=62 /DNA_ID=CAMNT_0009187289 /DNA_START=157 /DNA_END=345 /DNA_ORIENTATION=+